MTVFEKVMGLTVARSSFTVPLRERDRDGEEVEILRKSSLYLDKNNEIRLSGYCKVILAEERIGTLWRLQVQRKNRQ